MGQGWRRVSELVRQASLARLPSYIPGIDQTFRPTSNARNSEMFREATEFAAHLRTLERDLSAMHDQVKENFANLRDILMSPLPRVYEEGQTGPVASEEEARNIGQAVNVQRITEAAAELKRRQDEEVIQPIRQWMVAYRTIQDRMKQLEALRLELDSRRRTVGELTAKVMRQRSMLATNGFENFKTKSEFEQTQHRLQHKDEKLQRTASQYREMEQTVYNSLFTLVKDTSVLRDYAAAALLISEDCFHAAHESFQDGEGGITHLEYTSTNAALPAATNNYNTMANAAPTPAYGEALDYGRPEAPGKPSAAGGNIFRTLSEKVRFRKLDTHATDGTTAGGSGGGHDSDGERGYDQIYHAGNDYEAVQARAVAYDAGGHYRAPAHGSGGGGGGGASVNRYAAALPAGGGNPWAVHNY